jgi:tRNA (cmo5U34)-methyltransferase
MANEIHPVGDLIRAGNATWSFGGDVSAYFDSHVRRSVPFYDAGHDLIGKISDFFVQDGTRVYDLGCATGTLSRLLAERHQHKRPEIVAVDAEPAMIEQAQRQCRGVANVRFAAANVVELDLEAANLIVAYYTLQFISPQSRQRVFDQIYRALHWGGGFVLFEKVRAPDARFQDMMTTLYTDFKLDQGFSEAEIVHKTRSLKGVLEPFSTQGNLDLLRRAGFVDVVTVFKYLCFEGFLAIK